MNWKNINKEKPTQFLDVLVGRDEYKDGSREYFIAMWDPTESEWNIYFHGRSSDEKMGTFIKIIEQPLSNDIWCYVSNLPEPEE